MPKLTVKDLDLKDKKVFIRVDFNVPLDDRLEITDDTRIRASLPTIEYVLKGGGRPILASPLGRPKGKRDPKQSLAPVARRLEELIKHQVRFAPDCVGAEVQKMADALAPGEILLLENLRFHDAEEKNDPVFSRELARLADLYVNDAFGSAHRAHASVEGMAHLFQAPAAGLLMEKELKYLETALHEPRRPLLAIIGGAKVSTKIGVLKNLLNSVDNLVIGGGMCFTFYKAQGYNIGKSLCEDDFLEEAKSLLGNPKLHLPADVVAANEPKAGAEMRTVIAQEIPPSFCGVDIGPQAIREIKDMIKGSQTIVWNGPMGIFEIDEFACGTNEVAKAVAEATAHGAITIVGGGDTIAALGKFGLENKVSHASTGGGASLEFLEGIELPGVEALKNKT
jgi:phosphoglycerate kinase